MSDQEQEFADPGTSYGDRRPINTDPREQPGFAPPAINTDPREQPQWQAMPAPIMVPPPRRGRSPWFWLGVSVLILVVIFGALASVAALLTHEISATKSFTVGSQPRLIITAHSGDVHIVSGPANQISVVARERVFLGNSDSIPVHYQQNGDTLTISVDQASTFHFGFNFGSGIDLDITAPSQTALDVRTNSGDIQTTGITSQMTLTADSGDISIDGGSGQITITTSSGDIQASNVSGQMLLTASSGDIMVSNARASGSSTFQTSSGDISYSGSLDPAGSYAFRASSGDIDLTLPGDAAFQVQATTNSGSIDSDFSGVTVLRGSGSGALANGKVGVGPTFAQITIQTSSGDIHLRRA